jgi:hypothetical protein
VAYVDPMGKRSIIVRFLSGELTADVAMFPRRGDDADAGNVTSKADATFVAHLPVIVPTLLAEIDRLRALVQGTGKDTTEVIIRYPDSAEHGGSRITIRNDGTGTKQRGNYECRLFRTFGPTDPIPEAGTEKLCLEWRIEGYRRWVGIEALASLALGTVAEAVVRGRPKEAIVVDCVHGGTVERDDDDGDVAEPTPAEQADQMRQIIRSAWETLKQIETEHPEARGPLDLERPAFAPAGGVA